MLYIESLAVNFPRVGRTGIKRMGYEIEMQNGFFEVRLSGEGSKSLLFKALIGLMRRDPRKEYPDLWIVAPEFQIPFAEYRGIVRSLAYVFTKSLVSKRTAIVSSDNALQKAQLDLYQRELSSSLPVDVQVFQSRDEAIAWIKNPETQPPA